MPSIDRHGSPSTSEQGNRLPKPSQLQHLIEAELDGFTLRRTSQCESNPRFLSHLLWPFVSKRDQALSSKTGMEISKMEAISEGS